MSVRRSILVLFLLTLAVPAIVFNVRANREARNESTRELQTTQVARGDVEVTVTALGTIQADQSANLSFVTAGRVTDVFVQTGDYVLAGDVLAQVNSDPQQIAIEQAQLAVDLDTIQRDKVLEGPTQGQIDIAQANVDAAEAALYAINNAVSPDDILAAQLAYEAAQQALTDATQARATASGGQPDEAYALLDAQVGEASFNAETARLQLEALQTSGDGQTGAAYARLEQAQRELDQLVAGASQAQIDQAEAAITQAELNLTQALNALERTRLTAPSVALPRRDCPPCKSPTSLRYG